MLAQYFVGFFSETNPEHLQLPQTSKFLYHWIYLMQYTCMNIFVKVLCMHISNFFNFKHTVFYRLIAVATIDFR